MKMRAYLAVLAASCFSALSRCRPTSYRGTRFTQRHVDDRRPVAAGRAARVRRDDQLGRPRFEAMVAANRGAAEGRAERVAHSD